MSTKSAKKVILEAPNPLRRRINLTDTDGNESVGFHFYHGMEPPVDSFPFSHVNQISLRAGRPKEKRAITILAGKWLFQKMK
jgi:hypothetical protein